MTERPKISSFADKELEKVEKQFEQQEEQIKQVMENRTFAPPPSEEMQTKMSSREIQNSKEIHLRPISTIGSKEKFNERFREAWNFSKEYVNFIAENKELIGESITLWTKPYPGIPAEEWVVPVNKPIWGPRYLAEQIKRKYYNRLVMKESQRTSEDAFGQYQGALIADEQIQRLDCHPVSTSKSIFMGKSS